MSASYRKWGACLMRTPTPTGTVKAELSNGRRTADAIER
jgi:hypothetical protein